MVYEKIEKPLYIQIQDYITELILSGKLRPEEKIQSEREFSDDLGVSRMTVRKAITELVNDGMLERRHGSGTYVAKPKMVYKACELVNYVQAMQAHNISTNSQLLEFEEIVSSRHLSEVLHLDIGNPVIKVCLLRLANRVPVVLERIYFPCIRFPDLQEWNLEKSSLSDLITAVYKITLGPILQTIEAVSATSDIARQLRVEEGFPLLMLNKILTDAESGAHVVYAQDHLRSDYARIQADSSFLDTTKL